MPNKKLLPLNPKPRQLQVELPTVPDAFRRSEYEGWLPERIKQFQLRSYQRTQAERIVVIQQINQLQGQCLTLMHNEANWRHFEQEDRLRQKRLDIQEIELDRRLEELRTPPSAKQTIHARASEAVDPIQQTLNRLRRKLKVGVDARSECDRLKEEFPEYADQIEEDFTRMIWDLREES